MFELKHDDDVTHGTFKGDGKWVVTTSKDRTAHLWDTSYLNHPYGEALVHAVCKEEWSSCVTTFTATDIGIAPILKNRLGEDVCEGYR